LAKKRRSASTTSSPTSRRSGASTRTFDEELLESFRAGDCIAFIGAGFSAPVGLPLWKPLLNGLVNRLENVHSDEPERLKLLGYARRCIEDGQLPRAASVISEASPSTQIDQVLKRLYNANRQFTELDERDPKKRAMRERLDALLALPWAGIVTTNYDTLIHDYRNWTNVSARPSDNLGQVLKSSDRPFLIHLHGNVKTGQMILSEENYDEIYLGSSTVQSFLLALLLRYTVVFIGTLVEDRFVEYKRQLQLLFRDKASLSNRQPLSPEYVLLAKTDAQRGSYLQATKGFRALYYENTDHAHEGLVPLLRELREAVTHYDFGNAAKDPVNKRLLEIVNHHPKGLRLAELAPEFWDSIGRKPLQPPMRDLNVRELYFRLFFLSRMMLLKYDHVHEVYRPLAK
jgi:hypothetical protein